MRETLKMMRDLITGEEKNTKLDDLIQEYKENQSPNILAYLFVTNYGVITNYAKEYSLLDTQDIASYSLQELDTAILTFNNDKECKFVTYFVGRLKNRLRSEQGLLKTATRIANYYTEDIENHFELQDSNFEFELFNLNEYQLSQTEKEQCELLLAGYSVPEIAKRLNKTKQGIYYRNEIIGKKLANALYF